MKHPPYLVSHRLLKKIFKNLTYFFFIITIFPQCKNNQHTNQKLDSIQIQNLEFKYNLYKEKFIQIFLDEKLDRFNGAVPESIKIQSSDISKINNINDSLRVKFADGTIYSSFAILFLANDIRFNLDKNNLPEANRCAVLLNRVLSNLIQCDINSLNGQNGFLLRDIIDSVDWLKIESDFIHQEKGQNEPSGSQIATLFYCFLFAHATLELPNSQQTPELITFNTQSKELLKRIYLYLEKENFKLKSEIHKRKSVSRGNNLKWMKHPISQIYNYELQAETKHSSKFIWRIYHYFINRYLQTTIRSKDKYEKNEVKISSETFPHTFVALHSQLLNVSIRYIALKMNKKKQLKNYKYANRFKNGLAQSLELTYITKKNYNMLNDLFQNLSNAPRNHLPNNFSLDSNGWNLDNKWIRLMHQKKATLDQSELLIYNGLDYLCAYGIIRNSKIFKDYLSNLNQTQKK